MSKTYVIGDIVLDEYWSGCINEISSEAPIPIYEKESSERKLGGAANVAANVKTLGGDAVLISSIGNDDLGKKVFTLLKSLNIEFMELERSVNTVHKVRVQTPQQQILRVDKNPIQKSVDERMYKHLLNIVTEDDVVIIADYGKGVINNNLNKFLLEAREKNIRVIVDPKKNSNNKYSGAYLIKPNLNELSYIFPKININNIKKDIVNFYDKNIYNKILITMGGNGMLLVQGPDNILEIPALPVELFDRVGAGDTVIAVVGLGLVNGLKIEDACCISNVAAAMAVLQKGCAQINAGDLNSELKRANLPYEWNVKLKSINL